MDRNMYKGVPSLLYTYIGGLNWNLHYSFFSATTTLTYCILHIICYVKFYNLQYLELLLLQ